MDDAGKVIDYDVVGRSQVGVPQHPVHPRRRRLGVGEHCRR